MQWLGGWLKEIIIIILIASFADLLLPNKTMQRYVRTVIGLFLLMLLLSPVLRLFQMKWDTDALLAAVENSSGKAVYATGSGSGGSGKAVNTATLAAILQEGERLSAADQAAAKKLVEDRLADAVKSGVEGRFAERVLQAEVTTALDKNQTLSVKQVTLVLAPRETGAAAATEPAIAAMEPIRRIDPVKPVTITVADQEEAGEKQAAAGAAEQQKADAAFAAANEADIVAYIRDGWQIDPGAITVKRLSEE